MTGARPDYDTDAPPSQIEEINDVMAAYKETYRNDRVFVTPNLRLAMLYAVHHRSRAGQCYEVEPLGEIEADPATAALPGCPEIGTVQCSSARVVRIVRIQHHVQQTILNEDLELAKAQARQNGIKVARHKLKQGEPTSEQEQRRRDRRAFEKKQRKIHRRARG